MPTKRLFLLFFLISFVLFSSAPALLAQTSVSSDSSMSYLKSFPINMLKIDKSFIFGLPDSSEDIAITQAVIAMSHNLNIKVIAEGVEEIEQIDLLRNFGCDFIPGFYYARPMPFDDLFRLEGNSKISNKKLRMIKGGGTK